MMKPILMTREYWENTPLSLMRRTGICTMYGVTYILINKEGKDMFQCSHEADLEGRKFAIEPGEPADIIDSRFIDLYKKYGRDLFIEKLKKEEITEESLKNKNK